MERLKPVRHGEKLWRGMLEKRATESDLRVYSRRKVIAELAFGQAKEARRCPPEAVRATVALRPGSRTMVAGGAMLGWWRKRRRAKILASPFPDEWRVRLDLDVALWRAVPEAAKPRLMDDLRLFMAERDWEPCGGMSLDDAKRAVIAAQTCVLSLGRSVDAFDHVRSILVYPTSYRAPDVWEDEAGVVTEEIDEREGEAWERGIVVLSWQELAADARALSGRNLVLHEMAHQIDLVDVLTADPRAFEGGREEAVRRMDAFLAAYEAFDSEVEAGRRVKALDSYGAEDEAEFFAVATESFFERGLYFKTHQPELYEVLAWYYNQDPASWPTSASLPPAGTTGRDRRRLRREAERRLRRGGPS